MKIYTKNGDKGNTKLLYGGSVSKDNFEPEAVGTVDELVASLGIIRAESDLPAETQEILLQIQRELFIVGAELATTKENRNKLETGKTLVEEVMITNLEEKIDILEEKNGIPDYFVVPGENIISSKIDWARVVSRRAERKCVTLQKAYEINDSKAIKYLNRLSDYLWMLARDFEKDWTPSK